MIYWERVHELREEIGSEDFCEVVQIFLEEVEETLAGLAGAPGGEIGHEALHFLKGSALNLGFARLSELCREPGERAAGAPPPSPAELQRVYEASKREFMGWAATICPAA